MYVCMYVCMHACMYNGIYQRQRHAIWYGMFWQHCITLWYPINHKPSSHLCRGSASPKSLRQTICSVAQLRPAESLRSSESAEILKLSKYQLQGQIQIIKLMKQIWLVFEPPQWKIWQLIGMIITNLWKKTCSKPPTSSNTKLTLIVNYHLLSKPSKSSKIISVKSIISIILNW